MPTREQVFTALFAAVQTEATQALITNFTRRFTLPDQLGSSFPPTLMLWEQPEKADFAGPSMPRRRAWHAIVVVYFLNPSKTVPGATIINPIIDAIETALRYDNPSANRLTLGGLVEYCRIEGQIVKETGDTDANGLGGAMIPVRILVP